MRTQNTEIAKWRKSIWDCFCFRARPIAENGCCCGLSARSKRNRLGHARKVGRATKIGRMSDFDLCDWSRLRSAQATTATCGLPHTTARQAARASSYVSPSRAFSTAMPPPIQLLTRLDFVAARRSPTTTPACAACCLIHRATSFLPILVACALDCDLQKSFNMGVMSFG